MDSQGNVYVVDSPTVNATVSSIYRIDLADPPALSFASTPVGSTSSESPQTVTVSNFGNEPLAFSAVNYPADFPEAAGVASDCKSSTSLGAGADCTLSIDFTPEAALTSGSSQALSGSVTVTTNTLNTTATAQPVAVSGTETKRSSTVKLTAQPNPGKVGAAVTFTATVTSSGGGATPTGTDDIRLRNVAARKSSSERRRRDFVNDETGSREIYHHRVLLGRCELLRVNLCGAH